jgi:ATP:corrinoid adenosyltransferase
MASDKYDVMILDEMNTQVKLVDRAGAESFAKPPLMHLVLRPRRTSAGDRTTTRSEIREIKHAYRKGTNSAGYRLLIPITVVGGILQLPYPG